MAATPQFVVATLWEYIEPLDRGERYEDPLMEVLEQQELGEVCGGGSMLSDTSGIEFVDIEIELNDLDSGLPIVREVLEAQGAPKGSQLAYERNGEKTTIEFGTTECIALFLDGVNLPDEVYEQSDIDALADMMFDALDRGKVGTIRSCWVGPEETAVFMFGPDAEQMDQALTPAITSYPLCQNARVVVRHGKESLSPREYRIPMQT
jgi:hypothetical protein